MFSLFLFISAFIKTLLYSSGPISSINDLTDSTKKSQLKGYKYSFIIFYSDKCKNCKEKYSELSKTIKKFKDLTPKDHLKKFYFGQVEISDNFKLGTEYKIGNVPAIILRVSPNGDDKEYHFPYLGDIKSELIIDWLNKRTLSLVNYLSESNREKILNELSLKNKPILPSFLYLSPNNYTINRINEKQTDNYFFNIFLNFADNYDQYHFYYSQIDQSISDKLGLENNLDNDYIILFKNFGNRRDTLIIDRKSGNFSEKIMTNFVINKSIPDIIDLGELSRKLFFYDKKPLLIFFRNTINENLENMFRTEIGPKVKEITQLVITDTKSRESKSFMNYCGLAPPSGIALYYFENKDDIKRFKYEGDYYDDTSIFLFVNDCFNGKKLADIKSEQIPNEEEQKKEKVKKLVGHTFSALISDPGYDRLVLMYSSKFNNSKKQIEEFKALAEKYIHSKNPNFAMYIFDIDRNDAPKSILIKNIPTVFILRKGLSYIAGFNENNENTIDYDRDVLPIYMEYDPQKDEVDFHLLESFILKNIKPPLIKLKNNRNKKEDV